MRLINNSRIPQSLDDGQILAASGTKGDRRDVEKLSPREQRLVDAGVLSTIQEPKAQADKGSEKASTPQK